MNDQTLWQLTRDRRRELEQDAEAARLAALARTPRQPRAAERAPAALLGLVLAARRPGTP
jgi:hypothetical protein